jgi:hypothetical protein
MLNSAENMTGAPERCTYQYDFDTVPEFVRRRPYFALAHLTWSTIGARADVRLPSQQIDFCQKLTRWGESGVLGFLSHLTARPTAQLLVQSITTESRQQMAFRQLAGLFPMPVYFEVGIPQAFAWTLLQPYIKSCPAENSPLKWQIFPALTVVNGPSGIDEAFQRLPYPEGGSALSHNRTALSYPGREVELKWDSPGQLSGPYNQTAAVGAQVMVNGTETPVSSGDSL